MLIHFDYDGVLVDSFDHLLDITRRVQMHLTCGRTPAAEDLRTIRNLTMEDLGRLIEIPENRIPQFSSEMFRHLREDPRELVVYDGIPEVLKNLSRTHKIVILTANARQGVQQNLVRNGMRDYVMDVFGGESPGSKAEKMLASMKKFGFEKSRTFMIGDALSDITEGKKAGVKTIAVTWGFQPRERLLEGKPDFVVATPQELTRLFDSFRS
jgi:phosphoglycolate phosphatase